MGCLKKLYHCNITYHMLSFKGPLSGMTDMRQILASECPLKMIKYALHFALKYFFVIKMIKFLSWHLDHVEKQKQYTYCPVSYKVKGIRQRNLVSSINI